ncbi:NACHT and WD repeat domain-containing protein 2-like [Watersipora subatra]|uniref:NACHT and WD repeat domain-containing protein 2-like n=1 Tax=Watersipora subatra TaxID=2589382 RepID=UPI00355C0E48
MSEGLYEYDLSEFSGKAPQKSVASKRGPPKKGGVLREQRIAIKDPIDEESLTWAKRVAAPQWEPTEAELSRYVLSGRLEFLPPPSNKVVKIFLSSTFTDMYVERNYLFTEVYPRLQRFCQNEYSLEFQVVDMRWGVRDEARQDHSGPKTCMDELRSCQELSLGPNFVCLLGQRYGNRPLQSEISFDDWEILVSALESLGGEGLDLLKNCFRYNTTDIMAHDLTVGVTHDPKVGITFDPTVGITLDPTIGITHDPTVGVTHDATIGIILDPTVGITLDPTVGVTHDLTVGVTHDPTIGITLDRTVGVTHDPTIGITLDPTVGITLDPTIGITHDPTVGVTHDATVSVTHDPTVGITLDPTVSITHDPTVGITHDPTVGITRDPTVGVTRDSAVGMTHDLTPLNERDPAVSEEDFTKKYSPQLHECLRKAAQKAIDDKLMDEERAKKYFWSVTEEEVHRGILSLSEEKARNHALCFVRNLVNINYKHAKAYRFVELEEVDGQNVEDSKTTGMIKNLVEATKKHLGPANCFTFADVEWNDKGGTNEESLKEYLKELGEKFEEQVKRLITQAAEKKNSLKQNSQANLLTEIAEHDHQAIAKNKTFQGRDDIMNAIRKYIHSESSFPFTMYGDSGFGKTSLLAVASIRVYDWLGDTGEDDLVVVRRFLGTTPDSTNIGSLIHSITTQLSTYCKFVPPQTEDPMQKLLFTLISIPTNYRVVIFLDSLDQLSAYGKAHTLAWLPLRLPSNVKLIVSTLPKDHNILDLIRLRPYSQKQYVEVKILETDLAMKLMKDWLVACKRQLTPDQFNIVSGRFNEDANTSPLYIKLIFDVVIKMRSYMEDTKLKELLFEINSPVKCIRYIYNELKKKNGDLLVHRLFAYLHLSNLGLTENELVDLISLDDEVLNDVFQYHVPPLRRLPAVLWARIRNSVQDYMVTREANGGKVIAWYHRQFVEVGDTMFKEELPFQEYKREDESTPSATELCDILRASMVDYFLGKWAGKKKPFTYTDKLMKKLKLDSPESEEDRYVPAMPNILENKKPNLRKLGQLPTLLIKLDRIEDFFQEVFGNIEGLTGLFSMYSWSEIYEIADGITFDNQKAIGKDKDEVIDSGNLKNPFQIVIRSFLLTSSLASAYPKMLGPVVLGRILSFAPGSELLKNFVNGIYEKGPNLNSFVCPHPQLEGVGTYLIFEMPNDHIGSCVAMIEVVPNDHHFILTVSRKAVLINMEDGNIQMRYTPPDLLKDDSFHLLAAKDPMDDPKEIVATTRIVPKIYIFSLSQFDVGEIIDCRQIAGYEEMVIQALQVDNVHDVTAIFVHGNAHDGLLVFDIASQTLLYKFQNEKEILLMTWLHGCLHVVQPKKHTIVEVTQKKDSGKDKQKVPVEDKFTLLHVQFQTVAESRLALPGDSIVTAKSPIEDGKMAFATEDGHLYFGSAEMHGSWSRILLDSPAKNISFGQVPPGSSSALITACTKKYCYIIVAVEKENEEVNEESDTFGIHLIVSAKMEISLTTLRIVSESFAAGYHLGQLYVFKLNMEKFGHLIEIGQVRKFDAHSRPITGIIVNKDVPAMVLTAAEDGSVRVFHTGMPVHPLLLEANTFDRMIHPIDSISSASKHTASLSTDSDTVSIWDTSSGKITSSLKHTLQADECLKDVVCFDDYVVTVTSQGTLSFRSIQDDLIEEIVIGGFHKLSGGCKPNEVLVKCETSWHKFDAATGNMTAECVYDDRVILKHHYVNGQLSLLQRLNEEEELLIEIIDKEGNTEVNLSKETDLSVDKLQDFFCCQHFLVLLYPREYIFFNWYTKDVVKTEKLNKPTLISSASNTIALRNNQNVQIYRIDKGVDSFKQPLKLQQKSDQVFLTPDGDHLVVMEQKKMMFMYRVENLSEPIGQYSLYGEAEKVAFTHDSTYIVLGIADRRLFFLLLCDVQKEGHYERVKVRENAWVLHVF